MSVELNLQGLEEARRRLRGVAVFQVNSAANSCAVIASELAPRSDISEAGYLHMADAIKQTKEASENDIEAVVESPKDYSLFVEFGTVYQDAQPFFTPAFESARKQLGSIGRIF